MQAIPTSTTPKARAACRGRLVPALCGLILVAACASPPLTPNPRLTAAEAALQQVRAEPANAELAAVELERAERALQRARTAWREGETPEEVNHLAYVAEQQATLVSVLGQRKRIERDIERLGSERDARERQSQADAAQARAAAAQRQAAELAQRNQALETSVTSERERADQLSARLRQLQATDSDRGPVVTFQDVLFDPGQATLRGSAAARVDELAAVLRDYPERNVLVEGFTDATGSAETNQRLAEQRALAVKEALVSRGVAANRIVSRGHAERHPVASNASEEGRRQNRRVEVVLSDAKGVLAHRN